MLFGDQTHHANHHEIAVRIFNEEVAKHNAAFGQHKKRLLRSKVYAAMTAAGVGAAYARDWLDSFGNSTPPTQKRLREQERSTPNPKEKKIQNNDNNMARNLDFDDDAMDVEGNQTTPNLMGSRGSAPAGTSLQPGGSGETPISKPHPQFGLPETYTAILPWTDYFTAITNSNQNAFNFYFRLNSPYDCMLTSTAAPGAAAALAVGLFNRKYTGASATNWPATAETFPTSDSSTTAEAPQWRGVWDKLYNKYTVIGAEWKLTMYNPNPVLMKDVVVFYGPESISTANSGRVFPPNVPAYNAEFWPGLKWDIVRSRNDGTTDKSFTTISGRWKPGQVKHNVQNDEDVKTWTSVASTPLLTERMMIGIAQAAFNAAAVPTAIQCRLQIKYIVQYKDISVNALYPVSGQTPFALTFPTDILTLV